MILSEVKKLMGMAPLQYRWLDDERGVFDSEGTHFGIFVELLDLDLGERVLSIANIAFGVIDPAKFTSAEDLDTSLTNAHGFQRTIFSTVGAACFDNQSIVEADIICLGAADKAKEKRSLLYSLASEEIRQRAKRFSRADSFRVRTSTGTVINLLSAVSLTAEEQTDLAEKLSLTKV